MPRTTDATIIAALSAQSLKMALFAQLTFTTGTAYLWTGSGSVSWNGHTWTGVGNFLGFADVIEDGSTVEAQGVAIRLSGLDPTLLGDALNDYQLGLPAALYIGFYVSGSLYSVPLASWVGRMDQPKIQVSGDTASIVINCESKIVDLDTPADRRYTQQDQQMTYPEDTGMNFVLSIQGITTFWMSYPNNSNNV